MSPEPPRIRSWSKAPSVERWLRAVSALGALVGLIVAIRSSFIAGVVLFSVAGFVLTVVSPAIGDRVLRRGPGNVP